MEILLSLLALWGGYEWLSTEDEVIESTEVVVQIVKDSEPPISTEPAEPVYGRGLFIKTEQGYYISNLTAEIEGCYRPILVSDLTRVPDDNKDITVSEIQISCEE